MTPAAIEPATCLFVAEHLNHCAKTYIQLYGKCVLRFHGQIGLRMLQTVEQKEKKKRHNRRRYKSWAEKF